MAGDGIHVENSENTIIKDSAFSNAEWVTILLKNTIDVQIYNNILENKSHVDYPGLTIFESLENIFDLCLSAFPFLCLIPAQCECPAMIYNVFFSCAPKI